MYTHTQIVSVSVCTSVWTLYLDFEKKNILIFITIIFVPVYLPEVHRRHYKIQNKDEWLVWSVRLLQKANICARVWVFYHWLISKLEDLEWMFPASMPDTNSFLFLTLNNLFVLLFLQLKYKKELYCIIMLMQVQYRIILVKLKSSG